ncbi:hypothetical protein HDZ31DRAFT_67776 [Schizophyllum fasciatum]
MPKKRTSNTTEDALRKPGNPGVFQGRRRELLLEYKAEYLTLRDNAHKSEAFWKRLYAAYFGEFPYHLADRGPPCVLAPDVLKAEDQDMRAKAMTQGMKQLKTFFYNLRTKASTVTANLWRDILLKALRSSQPKPRREIDFHVYMRERRDDIVAEAKARWEALSESERKATPELVQRVKVAKEWLEQETEDVKEHIRQVIERSFAERMAAYEKQMDAGNDGDLDLEDTQRYHDNFASVIEPLLEQIVKLAGYTGATLIAAAPPQTEDGDFDTIAFHVGQTKREYGSLKFDEWEKEKYADVWVRHYLSWNILTSRATIADRTAGSPEHRGDGKSCTNERRESTANGPRDSTTLCSTKVLKPTRQDS